MTLRSFMVALTLLTGAAQMIQAQAIPDGTVSSGTLSFDARATLGDFTGTTDSVEGMLQGAPELGGVRGWVQSRVATLSSDNDKRDRDLRKSMETDKYPLMRFELEKVEPATRTADSMAVTLSGPLTLHGVTHQVSIPGNVVFAPGSIRVRGEFPVNVKDYEVGGLSKLLGLLAMDEEIVVHVDVTFATEP